jgi:hypothetical protein
MIGVRQTSSAVAASGHRRHSRPQYLVPHAVPSVSRLAMILVSKPFAAIPAWCPILTMDAPPSSSRIAPFNRTTPTFPGSRYGAWWFPFVACARQISDAGN